MAGLNMKVRLMFRQQPAANFDQNPTIDDATMMVTLASLMLREYMQRNVKGRT
jgi:hypothetical protein